MNNMVQEQHQQMKSTQATTTESFATDSTATQANNQIKPTKAIATQTLIALYCGSRAGNKPIYQQSASALASAIADC